MNKIHNKTTTTTTKTKQTNKQKTLAKVFSCEFFEIFKNTFSTDQLQVTEATHVFLITASKFKVNEVCRFRVLRFYFYWDQPRFQVY